MTYPHEPQFRLRPHLFLCAVAVAVMAGFSDTGQGLAERALNLIWSGIAVAAGFSVVWAGLALAAARSSVHRAQRISLLVFYLFPLGIIGSMVANGVAGQSALMEFTVMLPGSIGASAAAYWFYSRHLPPDTSLERTRKG
jgi:hypothetical protein